jgi:hypothetical protein
MKELVLITFITENFLYERKLSKGKFIISKLFNLRFKVINNKQLGDGTDL